MNLKKAALALVMGIALLPSAGFAARQGNHGVIMTTKQSHMHSFFSRLNFFHWHHSRQQ